MKPRNVHASAPIMRKGGVHEKTKSAKRQAEKKQLSKELQTIKAANGRLDCLWLSVFVGASIN